MATYYIQWKGVIDGPFQSGSILQMLESNRISKMHLISSDRKQWVPLGRSVIYAEANRAVVFNVAQSKPKETKRPELTPPIQRQSEPIPRTSVASNQSSSAFITGLCVFLGVITLVVIFGRQPEASLKSPEYPPQVRDATIAAWCAFQSVDATLLQYDKKMLASKICQAQADLYGQIKLIDVDPRLQEHIRQRSVLWQNSSLTIGQLESECVKIQERTEVAKGIGAVFGVLIGAGNDSLADATAGLSIAEAFATANENLQLQQIQQTYLVELQKLCDKFKEMQAYDQVIADELSKTYHAGFKDSLKSGVNR